MATIIRKGQIIPKRLGHITIHSKARHCILAGAMLHWEGGQVRQLSKGVCISVKNNTRPRKNGTRQTAPLVIFDLALDSRINRNRIYAGLAPIPTRKNLYARPPLTGHCFNIEYPETYAPSTGDME